MELFLETGFTSLNKKGEELCGDKVEQFSDGETTTLVLADGLVTACCLDRDGAIRLGDANTESLRTILSGGRANAMRRALVKGEASEELCRHCAYRVRHSGAGDVSSRS